MYGRSITELDNELTAILDHLRADDRDGPVLRPYARRICDKLEHIVWGEGKRSLGAGRQTSQLCVEVR